MAEMLTLAEIEKASGWADRSALNRLIGIDEIKDWLQGDGKPTRYPESSVTKFQNLKSLKEKGLTPKAIAVAVREMASGSPNAAVSAAGASGDPDGDETALVPMAQRLAQMTMPEAQAEGRAMVHDFAKILVSELKAANVVHTQEDRFLTRDDAAQMLACSPHAVGRYVRPVRKDTWSFLMVQEYMTDARKKALEKPQKTRSKRAKENPL